MAAVGRQIATWNGLPAAPHRLVGGARSSLGQLAPLFGVEHAARLEQFAPQAVLEVA
jgi:hypothetical protein